VGKGAAPFQTSRVSDRQPVQSFDLSVLQVLWDRTGHRLFLIGQSGVRVWSPENGIRSVAASGAWTFFPSLSPAGNQAVYTAYIDQAQTEPRVFLYDFTTNTSRALSTMPRTQAMFVKPGWVWYLEENTCQAGNGQCPPWGSAPTGRVYAQDLDTGHETQVLFAAGAAPPVTTNWSVFQSQDVWPLG
jgi:hypothetical protein